MPISDVTISYFRDGLEAEILLKLNDLVGISDNSSESFFFITLPFVRFIDALNDEQLFVMKADLQRIFPNESSVSDEVKPKDGAAQETQDNAEITPASPMQTAAEKNRPSNPSGIRERKKAETKARHQLWQPRYNQLLAENPKLTPSTVIGKVATEFGVSAKTIRNNIKIR